MRILLVATFRNEGASLLEWVAHHRRLGVTDFMIYQNGSEDTTVRQLRTLAKMGIVQFFNNDQAKGSGSPQFRAYRRASRSDTYREVDWAMTLDGDEFIQINSGDRDLPSMIRRLADDSVDQISLNWRLFGSDGRRRIDLDYLPLVFTKAERSATVRTEPRYFKSLIRPSSFGQLAIHGPRTPLKEHIVAVNGSGIPFSDLHHGPMRCTDPKERAVAQVNHYAVRDAASFLIKIARGNAGAANRTRSFDYFVKHDLNFEEDRGLASDPAGLAAAVDELNDLSGGVLIGMRRRSIARQRAQFRELMNDPEMAQIYDQIRALYETGLARA